MKGQYYTLCSGNGHAQKEETAMRLALIRAGISDYNLIKSGAALSPGAIKESEIWVQKGRSLFVFSGSISSNRAGDWIASAIAVGVPGDRDKRGIIREYTGHCRKSQAEINAKRLVREAMAENNHRDFHITASSTEAMSDGGGYVCCISAVPMWD